MKCQMQLDEKNFPGFYNFVDEAQIALHSFETISVIGKL